MIVYIATEASGRSALALAAALLLAGSHAAAATLVNGDLMPPVPKTNGESYNSTPVDGGPSGTFSFIATVCNGDNNGAGAQGEGLESRTQTLTNRNVLLNRDSGRGGVGSVLKFPETGEYADKSLAPNECVAVPYQIGLQQKAAFDLYVDFWLNPPPVVSQMYQCDNLTDCLLNANATAPCPANKPYGSVEVTFDVTGQMTDILKGCYSNAECHTHWWEETSDIDTCINAPYNNFGKPCRYCCKGDGCNKPQIQYPPDPSTWPDCGGGVCN